MSEPSHGSVSPFAPGTRVLHIGPHKTGTTTLQAAFHQNRERLTEQGVHYAGRKAHSMIAAMAAAGLSDLPTQGAAAGPAQWEELLAEVRGSDARLSVISSEFFCDADDRHVETILDALDRDRVQVVVTLRPLTRILASQWQQFMQNRMSYSFEEWLDAMLNHADETRMTPSFWRRHRHDRVVERWARAIGAENLTAVVVDETDKTMLMSAFEDLLDVEHGTLVPRDVGANRSLTLAEVEMLRHFNAAYVDRGLSPGDYTRLVRFGAARFLQERRPDPAEDKLLTPEWAVTRGLEVGAEMAAAISASGVRVVGDLSSLADRRLAPPAGDNPEPRASVEVASRFVTGLVANLDRVRPKEPEGRVSGPVESQVRELHRAGAKAAAGPGPRGSRRRTDGRDGPDGPDGAIGMSGAGGTDVRSLPTRALVRALAGKARARVRRSR